MTTSHLCTDKQKAHVLVVDDEAELYQMVAICLRQSGFRITTAENTADAYNLLKQDSYDAIVSDVMMPGEDGVTFLGRVHQTWPDIPVILMTGYAQLQMAVDAIKNGAFDFVHKPFDFDHIRKIVARAVNYSQLQRMEKNYKAELEETVTLRTAELKDAIVELDIARSALLDNATQKSEFMSMITHEMRTPMNGVVGGLSLLENEVATPAGKEYLEIIRESAGNMVALVDELLMYGREITGHRGGAVSYEQINLAADLKELVAEYQAAFDLKNIKLSLRIASCVPKEIWTHPVQLNRLIQILLGNALKFTERGGVCLEVSHEDHDVKNGRLYFSVIDSGIGIPDEMLERIFEPFVQVDSSTTRRYGGVGLGLAIAQQNAMMLGGQIWAERVPEGGSRFTFTMKMVTEGDVP